MAKEINKTADPIPEDFVTIEEAAEFWDTHSLVEYWEQTSEVDIDIRAPRHRWIPLAANLAQKVAEHAREEGVSVETLINLWIAEKLQAES